MFQNVGECPEQQYCAYANTTREGPDGLPLSRFEGACVPDRCSPSEPPEPCPIRCRYGLAVERDGCQLCRCIDIDPYPCRTQDCPFPLRCELWPTPCPGGGQFPCYPAPVCTGEFIEWVSLVYKMVVFSYLGAVSTTVYKGNVVSCFQATFAVCRGVEDCAI